MFSTGTCLIQLSCSRGFMSKFKAAEMKMSREICSTRRKQKLSNSFNISSTLRHKLLLIDATPRTIWDSSYEMDKLLQKENRSQIETHFLVDKLHHLIPKAKLLVIMRNPVDRLWSDFQFFGGKFAKFNALGFHKLIVESIKWWKQCTSQFKELYCVYGYQFPCNNITVPGFSKRRGLLTKGACWQDLAADRLRISLYTIFIEHWLQKFSVSQFLFIKFEEYIRDPVSYLDENVLPFIEVGKLDNWSKHKLKRLQIRNVIYNKNQHSSKDVMFEISRKLLVEFYTPYNRRLASLLDDDTFLWKTV